MQDTQLDSWDDIQSTLSEKRLIVYKAISGGSTLFEICKKLGWPVNRVSGRVTELRKSGRIVDSGIRRINPDSGKSGIVWSQLNELV